jgi:short-subunit dehydrogenase
MAGSMIGHHPCATVPEYCAAKAAVHHWVKAVTPVLHENENIQINFVMSGSVHTSARPDFAEVFQPQHMTTKETLITGCEHCLNDDENVMIGETIEVSHDQVTRAERLHRGLNKCLRHGSRSFTASQITRLDRCRVC